MDKKRIETNLKELLNYLFNDLCTYERLYQEEHIQHNDRDIVWHRRAESCQNQILGIIDDLVSLYKD